jgi:hypothetical protein
MIVRGNCFDLLDPDNLDVLSGLTLHTEHFVTLSGRGASLDLKQVPEGREDPAPPPPQLDASVIAHLSDLRKAGKGPLADELTREIDQARDEVARFHKIYPDRAGHVIVGRVAGEG